MKRILIWSLFTLLITTAAFAQSSFHGDLAHTGVFDSPAVKELKGIKWKFKADASFIGSPAIADGVVFVGSADSFLYALDEETGQQKWKFETQAIIVSSPAVANGLVYFGGYDGTFYAVDEKTGTLKWKFAMEYERRFQATHLHGGDPKHQTIPDDWDFYMSSPVVFNNRVYFGSGDKNVYALNAATGAVEWKFATGDVVHGSPAIADNTVYIGSWDSNLYALDAGSGKEKWRFKAGEDLVNFNQVGFQSSPTVVDGTVYIGCRDSHVYAIDAATGRKKWEHSTGNAWVSNTPAVKDGVVYVGTTPFAALDAATGKVIYEFAKGRGVFSSPALAGGLVYFGAMPGSLYALDAKSGNVAWEFTTDAAKSDPLKLIGADGQWTKTAFGAMFNDFEDGYINMYKRYTVGWIISSPVVDKGVIFVGSTDGNLYALQ
jgi:outer membrane protein assembly factor BamB